MYLIKTDSTGTFSCNADTFAFPTVTFPTAVTTNFSCAFTSVTCNSNPINFTVSNPADISYDACGCVPPIADFDTDYPNPNGDGYKIIQHGLQPGFGIMAMVRLIHQ